MQQSRRILSCVRQATRLQQRSAAALSIAAVTLCCARPAQAFRTAADLPDFAGTERVAWSGPFEFDLYRQLPFPLDAVDTDDAITSAFRTWTEPACSAFQFQYLGSHEEPAAPNDGRNTIEFVSSGWMARGYLPDAAGATDVAYESSSDGWRIAEADIYLNAEFLQWVTRNPPEGVRDVLSVVTHEGGHALGLLHNCESGGVEGAPDCVSEDDESATMYPFSSPEQMTLESDDIAGVCFLYPSGECPNGDCSDLTSLCSDGECVSNGPAEAPAQIVESNRGTAPSGDPCNSATVCESQQCTMEGWCALTCSSDADCRVGQTCAGGVCQGPGKGLGESCTTPDECLGGECVADIPHSPMCTRQCEDDCAEGWACGEASGRKVCLPVRLGGGGCNVKNAPARPNGAWAAILSALCLSGSLCRRRARICSHDT